MFSGGGRSVGKNAGIDAHGVRQIKGYLETIRAATEKLRARPLADRA
jgi:hypothetical protein